MFDVIVYIAMFITGIVVGYILVGLSNGRARKSRQSGSDNYASAAGRPQQLEEAITGAERANADAVETLENIQNLIHSVRDRNGNNISDMEVK